MRGRVRIQPVSYRDRRAGHTSLWQKRPFSAHGRIEQLCRLADRSKGWTRIVGNVETLCSPRTYTPIWRSGLKAKAVACQNAELVVM